MLDARSMSASNESQRRKPRKNILKTTVGTFVGVWSDFEYYRVTGLPKKINKYRPMTLHDTQ